MMHVLTYKELTLKNFTGIITAEHMEALIYLNKELEKTKFKKQKRSDDKHGAKTNINIDRVLSG